LTRDYNEAFSVRRERLIGLMELMVLIKEIRSNEVEILSG
jgi:hypothetical protein